MIVAGLATIPNRLDFLQRVIESIAPQVDHLVICFNGTWERIPESTDRIRCLHDPTNGLGDGAKFLGLELFPEADTYFSVDDDLVYPPDYVKRTLAFMDYLGPEAIVSHHGAIFRQYPIGSFYQDKLTHACLQDVPTIQPVTIPGTGVMAFHPSTFAFGPNQIRLPNMADIWVALAAQHQRNPVYVLPHARGYFDYNVRLHNSETIWGKAVSDDRVHTDLINNQHQQFGWKLADPVPTPGWAVPATVPRERHDRSSIPAVSAVRAAVRSRSDVGSVGH